METANTYTVTFSRMVFSDWRSRGLIDSLEDDGHPVDIVKETKRDITVTIDEVLIKFFIEDLEDQIEIISQNNDGETSMEPVYCRALTKFKTAAAQ